MCFSIMFPEISSSLAKDHHASIIAEDQAISPEVRAMVEKIPTIPPPEGSIPNFNNPATRSNDFIIVSSILIAFMVLFLLGRVVGKVKVLRKTKWDDVTCGLAMVGICIFYASAILYFLRGGAKHEWNIPLVEFTNDHFQKYKLIFTIVSTPTHYLGKITLYLLYLQIFHCKIYTRYAIYIGSAISTILYLVVWVLQLYYTIPSHGDSLIFRKNEHSESITRVILLGSACDIAIDLYLFFLPIASIMRVKMSVSRKIGTITVFSTGLLACICSAAELGYRLNSLKSTMKMVDGKSYIDETWLEVPVITLEFVEMVIIIIISCVPSTVAALRYYLPSLDSRYHQPRGSIGNESLQFDPPMRRRTSLLNIGDLFSDDIQHETNLDGAAVGICETDWSREETVTSPPAIKTSFRDVDYHLDLEHCKV